jgi:hypothetical protein
MMVGEKIRIIGVSVTQGIGPLHVGHEYVIRLITDTEIYIMISAARILALRLIDRNVLWRKVNTRNQEMDSCVSDMIKSFKEIS